MIYRASCEQREICPMGLYPLHTLITHMRRMRKIIVEVSPAAQLLANTTFTISDTDFMNFS
jgi:hypothetical protein